MLEMHMYVDSVTVSYVCKQRFLSPIRSCSTNCTHVRQLVWKFEYNSMWPTPIDRKAHRAYPCKCTQVFDVISDES